MAPASRRLAGLLLIIIPAVVFGGASLLTMIVSGAPGYLDNQVRQDLWRAGHAHAAVLLILSLVMLRYVDEANLSGGWRWLARSGVPVAAILMPTAFFVSVVSPDATEPNALIYLAFVGAVLIAAAVLTLGIGLVRSPRSA